MVKTKMEFKDFDKLVKTYYPLNKSRSRYLICFNDNSFYFYKFDKKKHMLIKESLRNGI